MQHVKLTVAAGIVAGGALLVVPLTAASGSTATAAKPAAPARSLSSVSGTAVSVPPGGHGFASVTCPAGKIVSGGGGTTSGFNILFTDSFASGNGWVIRGNNTSTTATESLTANAVCLSLG